MVEERETTRIKIERLKKAYAEAPSYYNSKHKNINDLLYRIDLTKLLEIYNPYAYELLTDAQIKVKQELAIIDFKKEKYAELVTAFTLLLSYIFFLSCALIPLIFSSYMFLVDPGIKSIILVSSTDVAFILAKDKLSDDLSFVELIRDIKRIIKTIKLI